ncbi:MAG: hypothetical protein AAGA90_20170 [Actinomycetota bacterium]
MRLGDLGDDGQAKARARSGPGLLRSEEPVEDPIEVVVGDATALVLDLEPASVQAHPDRRGVRAVLHGVVDQVLKGSTDHARSNGRLGFIGINDDRPPRRNLRPLSYLDHQIGQANPLGCLVAATQISRELEQLTDQSRELLHIGHGGPEDRRSFLDRHRQVGGEELGAHPDRRQRRSQLVAGVCDQPPLLRPTDLECGEHPVEASGQAADLVASCDLDSPRHVVELGKPLGRHGQLVERL